MIKGSQILPRLADKSQLLYIIQSMTRLID